MYKEKTDKEVVLLPSREPGDSVHSAQYDRQHATDKQKLEPPAWDIQKDFIECNN